MEDCDDTTPAEGSNTTPAPGSDTTPAQGIDTTPAPASDTTPASAATTIAPPPDDKPASSPCLVALKILQEKIQITLGVSPLPEKYLGYLTIDDININLQSFVNELTQIQTSTGDQGEITTLLKKIYLGLPRIISSVKNLELLSAGGWLPLSDSQQLPCLATVGLFVNEIEIIVSTSNTPSTTTAAPDTTTALPSVPIDANPCAASLQILQQTISKKLSIPIPVDNLPSIKVSTIIPTIQKLLNDIQLVLNVNDGSKPVLLKALASKLLSTITSVLAVVQKTTLPLQHCFYLYDILSKEVGIIIPIILSVQPPTPSPCIYVTLCP